MPTPSEMAVLRERVVGILGQNNASLSLATISLIIGMRIDEVAFVIADMRKHRMVKGPKGALELNNNGWRMYARQQEGNTTRDSK